MTISIDVHMARTDLLVYKIHETCTNIRTCIPWVLFKLDAVQKSFIFQGCKMHENAFQSESSQDREGSSIQESWRSWRCLLVNTNSDP